MTTRIEEHAPAPGNNVPLLRGSGKREHATNLAWLTRAITHDSDDMIRTLVSIMQGVAPPGVEEPVTVSHVLTATGMLLDRAVGKAQQVITIEHTDDAELRTLSLEDIRAVRADLDAMLSAIAPLAIDSIVVDATPSA